MKVAVVLLCLFGVLARADTSDRIRNTLEDSGVLNGVSEENGCRDSILDLVSGCSAELFPDFSITDFLFRLLRLSGGGFTIRNEVLLEALEKFEKDPEAALTIDGCCGAACDVAKNRCLCKRSNFEAVKDLLGDEAVTIMEQFKDTCLADNTNLSFDMTIYRQGGCGKKGKRAAENFVCSAD